MAITKPFVLDFDLVTGLCKSEKAKPTHRRVSNMVTQFYDEAAARKLAEEGNPLLYSFYELENIPERNGDLRYGTTIIYPGKVGEEYFMTKGHFHTVLDTA
ncbi:MAG: glucose-6-phosphate isomerase, partial [Oscillospiraceae bacterium]|nr:glucose-6-phosphate isomerase [Oscillospiraceae bacterium]